MDWVRLYHETPTDPKWRVIAKRSAQRIGDVIAVWNFVLCNASSNAVKRGETRNLVTEDIAAALDLSDADVVAILAAMEGKVIKNGALLGWEKRNPIKEDHSTERVKRWRETQRNAVKRPDKTREEKKEVLPTRAKPARAKSLLNGHEKHFNEFWEVYPKRVDKRDAMKAYAKALLRDEPEIILRGARGYAHARKDEDPQYTKGPAHWLNADCWLDDAAPSSVPLDPEKAAAAQDKADRILKRGKYAEHTR